MRPGQRVRVRFAPSPTGDLHVGGARSALFTWLFARQHEGDFILRIEDTDQKRYKEESVESITSALSWLGLDWDEGPGRGGPVGPYYQSERLPLYQEHARILVEGGHAYECFCSPERLESVRAAQIANRQPPGYDRFCRNLSAAERAAKRAEGITPVVRLKAPLEGTTTVYDVLRGPSSYENRLLEDAVLLKSDGFPTYHLAVVVDDHHMRISHVMRGEEWLPSAPLHVLTYAAFGWETPPFIHMPVILNPDGKGKLSKRAGAASVLLYKQGGYLPEALVNYLALVGWSYDDRTELFSLADLIEKFSIERVNPSPARYNYEKLLWFNQYYINHVLELDDLTRRVVPWLQDAGLLGDAPEGSEAFAHARAAVALIKDKMKLLSEAADLTRYFFTDPDPYEADLLVPKKSDPSAVRAALQATRALIAEADLEAEAELEAQLRGLAEAHGLKAGQLFMPIRVALTGRTVSPGLFGTLRVVGRERALERLDAALAKLG
ncbi:MAG: glutamate--tRNA ligase [Chloroflexi bacterium]|nr:MAG: glutamate--tRNA ligase [Chloroflexota bacterium]